MTGLSNNKEFLRLSIFFLWLINISGFFGITSDQSEFFLSTTPYVLSLTLLLLLLNHDLSDNINENYFIADEQNQDHSEHDCLHGIIKNLPKKYRDPLFLSDIKGLKQQEIANQLHLPLPTIKSQIQRARKQIAQGFMDCCGFKMNDDGHLIGEIQDKADCKVCH